MSIALIWILAAVLLALAAASPRFRKFGLALAAAAIVAIVVLILLNDRGKKVSAPLVDTQPAAPARQRMMDHDEYVMIMQDKKDPDAKHRILLTDVRFGEITATPDVPFVGAPNSAPAVFRAVQARLFNDSKRFTLTNYSYDLTVQDCVGGRCTTVYEQGQRGIALMIPPNQARDVTISLKPDPVSGSMPFKLIGTARIQLSCTDVRAYQTADGIQPADAAGAAEK